MNCPRQVRATSRRIAQAIFLFLIFFAVLIPIPLAAEKIPLKPQGYVSDFAQMMSPSTRQQIEQLAIQLNTEHQTELAVVTVPSIGNRSMEDYATNLFAEWGIGKKGANNGLLLLVAKNERQIRIEVGYGLEEKVPDAIAAEIYRAVRDRFKMGDYDRGFLTGAQMLAAAVGGTLRVSPSQRRPRFRRERSSGSNAGVLVFLFIFLFFGLIRAVARAATGRPAVRSGSSFPWWLIFLLGSGRGGGSSWSGGGFSGGGGGFGGFGGGLSGGGGAGGGW